jgi:hypothetical protein
LIPASVLTQYNITSKTLLPGVKPPVEKKTGILEITNDDKIIKAFLVARGLIGPRTENASQLRLALTNHAKAENKRLILL